MRCKVGMGRSNRPKDIASRKSSPQEDTSVSIPDTQPLAPSDKAAISLELIRQELSFYSGPLPSPRVLREFDEVVPGSARRLIDRFEKQSDHRMAMEEKNLDASIDRANRGLVAGLIVVVLALATALILGLNGQEVAAAAIGGGSLATVAGVFVYGSINQRRERVEKTKIMAGQQDEQESSRQSK